MKNYNNIMDMDNCSEEVSEKFLKLLHEADDDSIMYMLLNFYDYAVATSHLDTTQFEKTIIYSQDFLKDD